MLFKYISKCLLWFELLVPFCSCFSPLFSPSVALRAGNNGWLVSLGYRKARLEKHREKDETRRAFEEEKTF